MTDDRFRYGRDIPIEMRPKLYDKLLDDRGRFVVDIDAFVDNPQLLDEIKRQEEESRRWVERLLVVVSKHEDDAAFALVESGIAIERITRWTESGSTRRGFLVDCPADAASIEPYKACTISTELAPKEDHWDFVVSTTWHGEWRRLRP